MGRDDRGATWFLSLSRWQISSEDLNIRPLNLFGDLLPLVVILNPLPGSPPCGLPNRWVGDEEPQTVGQIGGISPLKSKSRAIDHFPVFRNITRQHTQAGAHGIQQRERKPLQI